MERESCKTGGLCPLKREKDRVPRLPHLTSRGSNTPSVPKGTVANMITKYEYNNKVITLIKI